MIKLLHLTVLGAASGLPYHVGGELFKAMLLDHGSTITAVGVASLLALPYSLKFLWAPLVDRVGVAHGRRRWWLIACQGVMALSALTVGLVDPVGGAFGLGCAMLMLVIAAATQDLVADAYRTEVCGAQDRVDGAAWFVIGYRLALIGVLSGGMIAAEHIGWSAVFLGLSMLLAVQIPVSMFRPEPPAGEPLTLDQLLVLPWRGLWAQFGAVAIAVLCLVASVRAADQLAGAMATPLMKSFLSNEELGWLRGAVSVPVMILGSLTAVVLGKLIGEKALLVVAVLLGGLSNFSYVILAQMPKPGLWATGMCLGVEGWAGGLLGTAFVAWFMSLCDPRWAGGQYALLSALSTLPGVLFSGFSGELVKQMGFSWYFTLTVAAMGPALLLLPVVLRQRDPMLVGGGVDGGIAPKTG